MGAYIMDFMASSLRIKALRILQKSFRPTLPTEFIHKELGFDSYPECIEFLKDVGCKLANKDTVVDMKSSAISAEGLNKKKEGSLL
eukprot:CAMPEP_0113942618 /NCGR_PEP_ID=MMETSP1339-20121228/8292_1 /TAXON_ID=94617 /ORGANISM="Fibrocapsa japonica" /LENGTH=85 /DNA_ID=CAMNT_0000947141 /DNA_START=12 /DNA_END=269 /DNA_ORIENTATION=+ /assembly_acc=CAM_ASM_000762